VPGVPFGHEPAGGHDAYDPSGHGERGAAAESAVEPVVPDGRRLPAVCESIGIRAPGAGSTGERAADAGWSAVAVAAVFRYFDSEEFPADGERKEAASVPGGRVERVQPSGVHVHSE